jgi:hypothetical protein
MATEQKAFTGETTEEVRHAILEKLPVQPVRLKVNMNRALSDLIMKALAKNPEERYQSGQELVRDLEQCKASASSIGTAPATPVSAKAAIAPRARANAVAAGAFAGPKASPASPPKMTASVAPAVEPEKPRVAVDPMMAEEEGDQSAKSTSFSEISELPPLKEVPVDTSFNPDTPESVDEASAPEPVPAAVLRNAQPEKPKIQVREVAQKAVTEIRKTPPKLYLYAIGGAIAVIGIVVAGILLHNFFTDRDEGSPTSAIEQITGARTDSAPASPASASASGSTPVPAPSQPEPPSQSPAAEAQPAAEEADPAASAPTPRGKRSKARPAAPVVVPAQLSVSSTPDGVEIAFDGSPLCQSPCTLTGIAPGAHTIVASKSGFTSVTRNVSLASGANASVSLQLTQSSGLLSVSSNPAGAVILIDGNDTGKLTPSQFTLNKPGNHTVTLRRAGYLDGNSSVNIELGQTATVNLPLTHLGSTDDIRAAGGRFKKVFGHGDAAGMGIVSIKTQPKGAQIMVNNRVLDKTSPFDFYLNPGTYVLDITMSGYRGIHRVITVQEGEKVAIEESLQPE